MDRCKYRSVDLFCIIAYISFKIMYNVQVFRQVVQLMQTLLKLLNAQVLLNITKSYFNKIYYIYLKCYAYRI